MLKILYNLLYAGTPAKFTTQFSVTESTQRLSRDVRPSATHALFRESTVGSVSESKVRLYRQPAFYSNPFQPVFIGSFKNTDGETVLTGTFTLRLFTKIFMTTWFVSVLIFCVTGVAFLLINREAETALAIIASVGLMLLGAAVVHFGKRFAHKDIDWLTNRITVALAAPPE